MGRSATAKNIITMHGPMNIKTEFSVFSELIQGDIIGFDKVTDAYLSIKLPY